MESGGAYGAAGATGEFQLQKYIIKPQVILRLIGWLFSIIVFGCIADKGWQPQCVYSGEAGACGYGTAVGVIAFMALMAFMISDAVFDNISNVVQRKYIVLADMSFSGLWTFMWFVCFCLLADLWNKRPETILAPNKSAPEAAIAFSFFSIIVFAALTVLAVRRYRQGIGSDFQSGYEPDIFGEGDRRGAAPYSGPSDTYQGSSEYRQSPFADPTIPAAKPAAPTGGGYQGQSY
jgi:hypothetical protein